MLKNIKDAKEQINNKNYLFENDKDRLPGNALTK